ncbi:MAG: acyl-CoA dehydrogenase family protein [Verrucomicrobia bacterium]|nr:acyl-CoA dehydrogenase family protein [Verrucomicrobiota bacterium]
MNFDLTPEQKEIQRLARQFATEQILPRAAEWDRNETYPAEMVQAAADLGLLNIGIPEEYGGLGLGMLEEALIGEELGYACMGFDTIILASDLAVVPLKLAGTDEQKKRFFPGLVKGLGAFCLSEADNGSDAAAMKTKAEFVGDEIVVNGTKMWITNGGVCSTYVVLCRTEHAQGHLGTVCVVVPGDAPGVSHNKLHGKMGQRCSYTAEVIFENVRVPKSNMLGGIGDGFKIAMKTLDRTRITVAAGSLGVARRALDESVKYARTRHAFGAPISNLQAIQFKLADMKMGLDTSRLQTHYAAWLVDNDRPHAQASAIAKCRASDVAFSAAAEAIQVHGGYGYMNDFPVEKLLRDVKLNQIYEGTNEIQRVVVARSLLR